MKKNQKTAATIGEMGRKITATTLALALSGSAWASDWKFGASIAGSETYTDNVTLGASGGKKSDFITTVTPTITAKKHGARLKVDASYSNQNLAYANDSSRNTTNHQLNARANAELFEDEIFLDATASISQAATSLLGASGVDNTSATGNLTSVRATTISPYWVHRFGSTATLNARYTVSEVGNSSSQFSDSTNTGTNLSLASGSAFGRVSWGLNFSEQTADYQDRSDTSFTSTSASLGYLISTRLRLTGMVGSNKNSYASSTGAATGGSFWNITGSWAPSTRTSLDLGFGHQYYGKTWNMAFKTRGSHSSWTADYAESVSTSNSQASFGRSASRPVGVFVPVPTGTTFTIDVTTRTGTLSANTPAPAGTEVLFVGTQSFTDPTQILSNQVLLTKRFSTGFAWKKRRSGINLNAYHSTQEALENRQTSSIQINDAFQNSSTIKQVGFNAGWTWDLTPLMNSNVSGSVTRNTFPGLNREDTTTSLQIGLNRKFSPHLNGSVSLRRQARDSNQNADYTENALTGSVVYTF